MKNRLSTLLLALALFAMPTQAKKKNKNNPALFTSFVYQGNDQVYNDNPLAANEFYSPILQGCYPDPSITRKGNDYYLVNSSFAFFPGVPIFHSQDLVNWTQIGNVLDRESQLNLTQVEAREGIYAPDIMYNPNNDTFYMITTHIGGGWGNLVVKTKDPLKGWSDPVALDFGGIDPALFFDTDGKAYVVHNDAPEQALYDGHRVIKIWEYDTEKDQVIKGSDQVIVDGGVDIMQQPIWIEGPHIYKKNDKYYLMCAEGGTGDWHSEVIFVSDSPKGPYTPAANNPILSQRYLSPNRSNKVDWAGHADLVETPDGKYYGVFLGIRPNNQDLVNTGRETFMLPVEWDAEFPVFVNGLIPLTPKLKLPEGTTNQTGQNGYFPNGNFTFTDTFDAPQLDHRWIAMRGPRETFAKPTAKGLQITPTPVALTERKPISALFHRQQHKTYTATTTLNYQPQSEQEMAGLVCYQNEVYNYTFGITKEGEQECIVLLRTENGITTQIAREFIALNGPVHLQVAANENDYRFNYAFDDEPFANLGGTVSGDILSTNVAGGFTGSLVGMYASSKK